jgi:RimJ/RimL family protein N-acetyltransferase
MPVIPDLEHPLTDGSVALRLTAERDIPEILIAYENDVHMHERLGEERPPSGAELGRQSERADADRAGGTYVALTIVQPGADECVGQIRVHTIDWTHARAELGVWLAPQVRGQGLAARALRLAARWLFDRCGLERLQMMTEPDNEPMLRAARAAGFVHEGVLRGYTRERGARFDCAILSLLRTDILNGAPARP